jgi:hypothetical protein
MRITAALSWWNEKPEDLDRCVRSVANAADRIVAVDGAYRRYPGGTVLSDPAQASAIREAALAVGIDCLIVEPTMLWAGALEKRTYAMATAAIESDWVCIVDADYVIVADKEAVKAELAQVREDVVATKFYTPPNGDRPVDQSIATNWHKGEVDRLTCIPMIVRALPGLRVELHHWTYSAIRNGQRCWLTWTGGSGPSYPQSSLHTLQAPYLIEHMCLHRTEEQVLAARAYYNDREMIVRSTGQEDDVPGLPEPRWDYTTIPF